MAEPTSNPCAIDHITVTANTLESGAAWVHDLLGVDLQAGGAHPRMGTHNRLLRLGERMFLEVIAIDPQAAPPERPRWFALDDRAPDVPPRLTTWVVRMPDLRAAAARMSRSLGEVETMTRGSLQWLITIPADGRIGMDGIAPALIEWPPATHPAAGLEDRGCTLSRFEIHHPDPGRVRSLLDDLRLDTEVDVVRDEPGLVAWIETPNGMRRLGGDPR